MLLGGSAQSTTAQACGLKHIASCTHAAVVGSCNCLLIYKHRLVFRVQVRIIDKHLEGGKLYLKKGTVVDVHPGATCDVTVDDTRTVVQVSND